jgi:hypothetical protein
VFDLCAEKVCSGMTKCDPSSGKCVDHMCHIIACPPGTMCDEGNCVGKYSPSRPGCTLDTGAPASDFGGVLGLAFGLAVFGLLAARRRRR